MREAALKNHKSKLASLDPFFYVDSFWLQAIMGEVGLENLTTKFLKECVPSDTVQVELADAVKAAKKLVDSDLYKVLEQEFQNRLNTCVEWLNNLSSQTPPSSFKESNAFLTTVWARLPLFFKAVEKSATGAESSNATTLRGKDAITASWEKLKDLTTDKITVSELDAVYVFKPWMSGEVQKAITKKRQAVVAAALKTKPSKPTAGAKCKSKLSADDKALQAARKLLAKKT
eukprot:6467293-Amphidinium_carterae.1